MTSNPLEGRLGLNVPYGWWPAASLLKGFEAGGFATVTEPPGGVQALRCRLYTQGPARLDVTATGYTSIEDQPLSLDTRKRCEIAVPVVLMPEKPDAGK